MIIKKVDLRSDTVTKPTVAMRKAMADAEVGDDLYGDDPTVQRLESIYAEMVGKEASLFFPSGVMANQAAIRTHCLPGSFVAAGSTQHVVAYEYGGSARNAGVSFFQLDDTNGTLDPKELQNVISTQSYWDVELSLICIENTHMASGGKLWKMEDLRAIRQVGEGINIHMDGARLFNAQVAIGIEASKIAQYADSVMSCISKGLCAPVGSLLAGNREFIKNARRERARLGGQMRQVGILAAAGIVALETMIDRLSDDHDRATILSQAISKRFGGSLVSDYTPDTNIVVFDLPNPEAFVRYLLGRGVLANPIAPNRMRFVTHHDLTDEDIEYAVRVIADAP